MPALRPSSAALARAARAARQSSAAAPAARPFFSTTRAAASQGSQFDPPTGWLFGVKPGEKYQKEGWENIFYYGFCGSLVVFTIAYAFKPDTS